MRPWLLFSCLLISSAAHAGSPPSAPASPGILGYWSTANGSVLHIHPCGQQVCITVVAISSKAPGTIDAHNPDPALRSRPVCLIDIGTQFHLTDANHGDDGRIYDPETGKTYKASIASKGDSLDVRGYILVKALGRSETWTRTNAGAATCSGTSRR